jgi:hypothetical protein
VTRIALLPVLAATLALAAQAASAPQPPLRVLGFSRVGTLHVRGGDPAQARRAFGRPVKTQEFRATNCRISWPGLAISFHTLVHAKECRDDTPFRDAHITRQWVTNHGLRQGDTVAKARKL